MDRLIFTHSLTIPVPSVKPTDQGPNGKDLKLIVY